MEADYVETETRFTQSGRQIDFVYDTGKMPLYSMARAVYFKKAQKPEEFVRAFGKRSR